MNNPPFVKGEIVVVAKEHRHLLSQKITENRYEVTSVHWIGTDITKPQACESGWLVDAKCSSVTMNGYDSHWFQKSRAKAAS